MLHTIRIYNPDKSKPYPTFVEFDGKLVKGVTAVDFHHGVNEPPRAVITVNSMHEYLDMGGVDASVRFTPKTISDAAAVIQSALIANEEFRKAWEASIKACIDESHEVTSSGLAKCIVDWLIGVVWLPEE